jgi:hypothetical protein
MHAKVLPKQVGQNLEVYVDDIMVKTQKIR